MITQIRKSLKTPAFRFTLIVLVIALAGGAALIEFVMRQFGGGSTWAFRINGQEVSPSHYAHVLQQQDSLVRMLKMQYGELAELLLQMSGLPTAPGALAEHEIIQNTLLKQQATQAHIVVSPKMVKQEMAKPEKREQIFNQVMPPSAIAPGGIINEQALSSYLKAIRMTDQEFEALIEDVVTRDLFLKLISGLSYVPRYYVDHQGLLAAADRVITIAQKPVGSFDEPVDDAQVEEYYGSQLNQGAYTTPEKRSATLWKFDPSLFALKVSPDEIQQYYQDHKEQFLKDPAKVTVQYALFKENDLFDTGKLRRYAQQLHDKATAQPNRFEQLVQDAVEAGADVTLETLEPFAKGELIEEFGSEFDRKTMTLPADNALTPVMETPKGLLLAKRIAKTRRSYKDLDVVEQEIKNKLVQNKFERRFVEQARVAIEEAEDPQAAVEAFASNNGAKKQDFPLAAMGEEHYDQFVFASSPDAYSPYLDGQVGIIVKVNAVEPSQAQPLDQIFDTVKNDLARKKAKDEAMRQAQELLAALKVSPSGRDQVIAEHGFITETLVVPTSDDAHTDAAQELEKYGISPKDIQKLGYVNEMIASQDPETVDKAVYVVILDELIDTRSGQEQQTQDDSLRHYLTTRYELVQAIQSGLVASLRKNAKIEANSSMLAAS